MIHYFYYPRSQSALDDAYHKYQWLFDTYMSDESREVRYRVLEFLSSEYGYDGKIERDSLGGVLPVIVGGIELFLSFSHSCDHVAFACSDSPIGIDIAEYGVRDDSILTYHSEQEYTLMNGVSWQNFYILWTAKESIIKLDHLTLDDMRSISLVDVWGDVLLFGFLSKKYKIHTQCHNNLFISYAIIYESI